MKKPALRAGQVVSTNTEREAYYSGYAGLPRCTFAPGDVGVIAHPDVPPVRGKRDSMVVIDFWKPGIPMVGPERATEGISPHNGHAWRVALWPEQVVLLGLPEYRVQEG